MKTSDLSVTIRTNCAVREYPDHNPGIDCDVLQNGKLLVRIFTVPGTDQDAWHTEFSQGGELAIAEHEAVEGGDWDVFAYVQRMCEEADDDRIMAG